MKYQIAIPKIHCSGCISLIKMSLGEVFGEKNVSIDEITKVAEFNSNKDLNQTKEDLDAVFKELKESGYEYIDFKKKS